MVNNSPYLLTQKLAVQIGSMVSSIDVYELDIAPRKAMTDLRDRIADARLDVRDYELSETRDEQLKCAQASKKRLARARKDILAASEYGLFAPADVAQLTSNIDHIIERLE